MAQWWLCQVQSPGAHGGCSQLRMCRNVMQFFWVPEMGVSWDFVWYPQPCNLINTEFDWHNWQLKNLIKQSSHHLGWSVQRTVRSFFGRSKSTLVRPSSIFMRREFNLCRQKTGQAARGGHNISWFTNHRIPEISPLGRIVLDNPVLRVILCDSNSNSPKTMQNVISVPIKCTKCEGCSKFFHLENAIFAQKNSLSPNFRELHVYLSRYMLAKIFGRKTWMCEISSNCSRRLIPRHTSFSSSCT